MVKLFLLMLAGCWVYQPFLIPGFPSYPAGRPAGIMQATDSLAHYARRFNSLNTYIRDGRANKVTVRQEVIFLCRQIRRLYLARHQPAAKTPFFPLAGYSAAAIGGTHGEGYVPGRYHYFDGNRHLGHPAHDLFIQDRDQNGLDDRTGQPVAVLSLSEGVVVASEDNWRPGSPLRGGLYVWVYDPRAQRLYYYAHNRRLWVQTGAVVQPDTKLAEVGRTGLNAYARRSPTHLHLMALELKPDGSLPPLDLYPILKKLPKGPA